MVLLKAFEGVIKNCCSSAVISPLASWKLLHGWIQVSGRLVNKIEKEAEKKCQQKKAREENNVYVLDSQDGGTIQRGAVNLGLVSAELVEQAVRNVGREDIVQLMNVNAGKSRQLLRERERGRERKGERKKILSVRVGTGKQSYVHKMC